MWTTRRSRKSPKSRAKAPFDFSSAQPSRHSMPTTHHWNTRGTIARPIQTQCNPSLLKCVPISYEQDLTHVSRKKMQPSIHRWVSCLVVILSVLFLAFAWRNLQTCGAQGNCWPMQAKVCQVVHASYRIDNVSSDNTGCTAQIRCDQNQTEYSLFIAYLQHAEAFVYCTFPLPFPRQFYWYSRTNELYLSSYNSRLQTFAGLYAILALWWAHVALSWMWFHCPKSNGTHHESERERVPTTELVRSNENVV